MLFDNNPSASSTKIFLDISDLVSDYFYAGLFGITFHPEYPANNYFYVYYLGGTGAGLTMHLSRFTVSTSNPDSALRDSEFNLLTLQAPNSNQNGSSIRFGPDFLGKFTG